jgi:hypothetical protein
MRLTILTIMIGIAPVALLLSHLTKPAKHNFRTGFGFVVVEHGPPGVLDVSGSFQIGDAASDTERYVHQIKITDTASGAVIADRQLNVTGVRLTGVRPISKSFPRPQMSKR